MKNMREILAEKVDELTTKAEELGYRIVGTSVWSPVYFKLLKPIVVYELGDFQKTNAYYGSSRISTRSTQEMELKRGTEIHWLPGGLFYVSGSRVGGFVFYKPAGVFERQPNNELANQIRLRHLFIDGVIEIIKNGSEKRVKYPRP